MSKEMTDLDLARENYRFMVGMFSIALFVLIIFGGLYCASLKEKLDSSNHASAYHVGWQQGYLRAIQAKNNAVVRNDTIALSEFEEVMKVDLAEFKRLNNLE